MKEKIHTVLPAQPGFFLVQDIGGSFESTTCPPETSYATYLMPIIGWSMMSLRTDEATLYAVPITIDGSHNNDRIVILQPNGKVECPLEDSWESLSAYVYDQWNNWRIQQESTPEVKVVFEPACPTHDQPDVTPDELEKAPADLQAACMAVVNGDKEKKKRLVEILGSYDAKTINGLAAEYHDEFWSKVKDL